MQKLSFSRPVQILALLALGLCAQTLKIVQKSGPPIEIALADVDSLLFVPASSSSSGVGVGVSSSSGSELSTTTIVPEEWRDVKIYARAPRGLGNLYVEVRGQGITDYARFPLFWDEVSGLWVGDAHTPKVALTGPWKVNLNSADSGLRVDTMNVGVATLLDTLFLAQNVNLGGIDAVRIGSQTWMKKNLDLVPTNGNAWCASSADYCSNYGRLYDFAGAMNLPVACNSTDCSTLISTPHQGACPAQWHVPTDAEWTVLSQYLGGSSLAGSKMKENHTTFSAWNAVPNNAGNSSGFSALPAGYRLNTGSYSVVGSYAYFWTSSTKDLSKSVNREMGALGMGIGTNYYDKGFGFSVRCVRD